MVKIVEDAKKRASEMTHIKTGPVYMLEKHELIHVLDLILEKLNLEVKLVETAEHGRAPTREIKLIPKT